jgi:hypothetical protein
MGTIRRKVLYAVAAIGIALGMTACSSAADTASRNVSIAADNFEVSRLIVGINGITDQVLFSVEGACSITRDGDLVVICKTGPDQFEKHYIGLSHNVTFISTQLGPVEASDFNTRIIFRPETVVPNVDLSTSVTGGSG